jgi:hypothetical protein
MPDIRLFAGAANPRDIILRDPMATAQILMFAAANAAASKEPRWVIELAFDPDNTILRYFTAHAGTALPPGATAIQNVIEGLSVTSQTLKPDTANATIGTISFSVVDKNSTVTALLGDQLTLGRSTRLQRVRCYQGFAGGVWPSGFQLIQTQIVDEISFHEGAYTFMCLDIQRQMRDDIFDPAKTTLQSSVGIADQVINVVNTAAYERVAHGVSYSDAPNRTVGYIKLNDEIIRYSGKTSTTFIVDTDGRGVLNTRPAAHPVDVNQAIDQRSKVEELIYLELPAVKLIYAILTGILLEQGGAVLPSGWHLGIPLAYVWQPDFFDISKLDLWNPDDDEQGFIVRFIGLTKRNGKEFLERELNLLIGTFMPIYADGSVGLRRMAAVLAGAAYSKLLDASNVVNHDALVHDFGSLHNILRIDWNYEVLKRDTTRTNVLVDGRSVAIHQRSQPLALKFLGLNGSRHSPNILQHQFDYLRDRYTGPPLRKSVQLLPSCNDLEVGDIVRLTLGDTRDFVANSTLDRSWEVQNVSIDWIAGNVNAKLFASSQAASPVSDSGDLTVLPDSWYAHEGNPLASVVTIAGSNPAHVISGGTLLGRANLNDPDAIYYFVGDLAIDPGVTIAITDNVQIRVAGFLQNNGTINGVGRGLPGVAAVSSPSSPQQYNAGTPGFIGVTEAGGGYEASPLGAGLRVPTFNCWRGGVIIGLNSSVPEFNLSWDGTTLSALPGDLRGSSGSSGMPSKVLGGGLISGGTGGPGGAGLLLVCRGFAQGASGKIDISGGNGLAGGSFSALHSGSGAGGAPGGFLIVLDGAGATATDLTETAFVALNGATPIVGTPFSAPSGFYISDVPGGPYSYFIGSGDGSTFAKPSLSGARGGSRVQYVPSNAAANPDPSEVTLASPTNFGLDSGSDQTLIGSDGTVTIRVLAQWTAVPDVRVAGYELQFKRSTDTVWSDAPTVRGQSSTAAWIVGLRDGIAYDFRLRAAGDARQVSEWVSIPNFLVLGKSEAPQNVGTLSLDIGILKWTAVTDSDIAGYLVRYNLGSDTIWETATSALHLGFITNTQFNMEDIPGGLITMLVKAIDTSGNKSIIASSLVLMRPSASMNWTVRTSVADRAWIGIAWSPTLGLFAAVAQGGTGNRVMTSPDGINWTSRTSAADNDWLGIAWSPTLGLFAAVAETGAGNRVMTSPDGINWTLRTSAADNDWTGIDWSSSLGLFAAVAVSGTGNRVMTSPDGINWTLRTSAADNDWTDIAWSPELGLFAAVSANGLGNRVMTSPDGINWTLRTSAANNNWAAIAWSPTLGLFAAVAHTGAGNLVMTSPDGINWTPRTSAANNIWSDIAWSPTLGLFAAVAQTGTANRVMTSSDGISWTSHRNGVDNIWVAIAWSPTLGLFAAVAVDGVGNRVLTSK